MPDRNLHEMLPFPWQLRSLNLQNLKYISGSTVVSLLSAPLCVGLKELFCGAHGGEVRHDDDCQLNDNDIQHLINRKLHTLTTLAVAAASAEQLSLWTKLCSLNVGLQHVAVRLCVDPDSQIVIRPDGWELTYADIKKAVTSAAEDIAQCCPQLRTFSFQSPKCGNDLTSGALLALWKRGAKVETIVYQNLTINCTMSTNGKRQLDFVIDDGGGFEMIEAVLRQLVDQDVIVSTVDISGVTGDIPEAFLHVVRKFDRVNICDKVQTALRL